jgi:hypothetical protein
MQRIAILPVLLEPPAVYRGSSRARQDIWQGIAHTTARLRGPAVLERIRYVRSAEEIEENEPYRVSIAWQIHSRCQTDVEG